MHLHLRTLMHSTNGDQPRGTRIIENLVHENGHFSKQASPYFQAKAAQTVLQGNIFFNGPRAGINFKCVRHASSFTSDLRT